MSLTRLLVARVRTAIGKVCNQERPRANRRHIHRSHQKPQIFCLVEARIVACLETMSRTILERAKRCRYGCINGNKNGRKPAEGMGLVVSRALLNDHLAASCKANVVDGSVRCSWSDTTMKVEVIFRFYSYGSLQASGLR